MGAPNALALAGRKGPPSSLVRQCQEMMSAVPPAGGQSVERNGHTSSAFFIRPSYRAIDAFDPNVLSASNGLSLINFVTAFIPFRVMNLRRNFFSLMQWTLSSFNPRCFIILETWLGEIEV